MPQVPVNGSRTRKSTKKPKKPKNGGAGPAQKGWPPKHHK